MPVRQSCGVLPKTLTTGRPHPMMSFTSPYGDHFLSSRYLPCHGVTRARPLAEDAPCPKPIH